MFEKGTVQTESTSIIWSYIVLKSCKCFKKKQNSMYEYIIEDLYPWKNKFYVKDIWSNGFELREFSFFFFSVCSHTTYNKWRAFQRPQFLVFSLVWEKSSIALPTELKSRCQQAAPSEDSRGRLFFLFQHTPLGLWSPLEKDRLSLPIWVLFMLSLFF